MREKNEQAGGCGVREVEAVRPRRAAAVHVVTVLR